MHACGRSIVGSHRKNNEDAIFINKELEGLFKNLFIVADGMGGHNAGEIASMLAITSFVDYIKNHSGDLSSEQDILDIMIAANIHANSIVYEKATSDDGLVGMGTTMDTICVYKNKMYITHVGDSRVYMLRDDEFTQLTKDHSYVMELVKIGKLTEEEAKVHPKKNIITRAVGIDKNVEIDTVINDIYENDQILLCTDGLTNMVANEEIKDILKSDLSLLEKTDLLINTANKNGGMDNISAILLKQEATL